LSSYKSGGGVSTDKNFVGRAIRASKVLCIDGSSGQNLGVMSTTEAIKMASEKGLDLVQIQPPSNGRPPTCKIMDYGKYRYDESKKQKASEKKRRESEIKIKEIKIRPVTDTNDLEIKAKKAIEFIDDGCKVKVTVFHINKREMMFKDVTLNALNTFLSMIPNTVVGQVVTEGKNVSVIIEKMTIKRQVIDNNR